jgi:hypothetical protein
MTRRRRPCAHAHEPLAGVLPTPPEVSAGIPLLRYSIPLLPESAPVRGWTDDAVPSDDQRNEPSCVGRAWAGWYECMLRRYVSPAAIPAGMQLDASAIWRRGREMFWGGRMDGGLHVHQGCEAAVALGVLPPGSRVVRVTDDWGSIGVALTLSPIVQAHAVGASWYRPDRANGYVPDEPADPTRYGYHCTLLLERLVQDGAKYLLWANSWGAWGWHGLGLMALRPWTDALMPSSLHTAQLPDNWEAWDGWKEHLVPA